MLPVSTKSMAQHSLSIKAGTLSSLKGGYSPTICATRKILDHALTWEMNTAAVLGGLIPGIEMIWLRESPIKARENSSTLKVTSTHIWVINANLIQKSMTPTIVTRVHTLMTQITWFSHATTTSTPITTTLKSVIPKTGCPAENTEESTAVPLTTWLLM